MQLYILRHGDALSNTSSDALRPLSPFGEQQVQCVGVVLKKLNIQFDTILCSPLLRSQQTARIVQEKLGAREVMTTEHLVPTFDHRHIFHLLSQHKWNRVLLVGHEPHLSSFISLLTSDSRDMRVEMKTSSLALCDASPPIEAGRGILRWLMNPELSNLLGT